MQHDGGFNTAEGRLVLAREAGTWITNGKPIMEMMRGLWISKTQAPLERAPLAGRELLRASARQTDMREVSTP